MIAIAAVTLVGVGIVALSAISSETRSSVDSVAKTATTTVTTPATMTTRAPIAVAHPSYAVAVAREPVTVALPADRHRQPRADLAEGRAVLLDVREQHTWDDGNIEGAVSFPWSWLQGYDSADELNTIPTDKIVYIYGDASGNATLAATLLSDLGFDARAFEHGFTELAGRFRTGR